MAGRFLSNRDINNGIDRFNKELLESVIGQTCILYKLSVGEIETNVYGETTGVGKVYQEGVEISCLISSDDISFQTDDFGPDAQQSVSFGMHRNTLIDLKVAPEIGDIIKWNYAYFEINSINENKLLGGDVEKNHDLVATCHLTRTSKLNIIERTK